MSQSLALKEGKRVTYQGRGFRIARFLSLQLAELVAEDNHEIINANIADLQAPVQTKAKRLDLTAINEQAWETARKRFSIIEPLLNISSRTRAQVTEHGLKHSISTNTLYNWIKAYEESGVLSSLLPKTRKDKGTTKLSNSIEEVIQETIATDFLTLQKKSIQKLCDEVIKRCVERGLERPHHNTIRNRVKTISPELKARRREGNKKLIYPLTLLKAHFLMRTGHFLLYKLITLN